MYFFHNDYNEACHTAVLSKMAEGKSPMPGYGMDQSCANAARLIREKCNNDNLSVHFLVGGTQTNMTVIASALRPHQAVIAADSGHIHVHETGAIEATGHKIIALPHADGKITPAQVEEAYLAQSLSADAEHIAQPKMVYISNPTEFGTTYSLKELTALSDMCAKHKLYLFVDGARLGYALVSQGYDVTLEDMAQLTDVFYIGGTKCGALFGEAVVIRSPAIAEDFRYMIKQRGGMLAKGWLLGQQFEALLEDDLYFTICRQADMLADKLRQTVTELGCKVVCPNKTNQVFVTLPDRILKELGKEFTFAVWAKESADETTVRFCTSWATQPESVDALCAALKKLVMEERGESFV